MDRSIEVQPNVNGNESNMNLQHQLNAGTNVATGVVEVPQSPSQLAVKPRGQSRVSAVTPGNFLGSDENRKENDGGEGMAHGETLAIGDEGEGGDTSDSSEAEINEIRTKIAVNALLTEDVLITPGGASDVHVNVNVNGNGNGNDDINVDKMYEAVIEMEKQETQGQNQNKNLNNNGASVIVPPGNDNFASMLNDKLVGIDMLADDIVDEMEQDVQDPNGKNRDKTPGHPNVNHNDNDLLPGMNTAGINLDEGEQ